MKTLKILLLISLIACGKPLRVEVRTPEGINFGPDFRGALELCDSRYGYRSLESEECFNDYRTYFQIKLSLDLDSITQYCQKYPTEEERQTCEENLLEMLKLNQPREK